MTSGPINWVTSSTTAGARQNERNSRLRAGFVGLRAAICGPTRYSGGTCGLSRTNRSSDRRIRASMSSGMQQRGTINPSRRQAAISASLRLRHTGSDMAIRLRISRRGDRVGETMYDVNILMSTIEQGRQDNRRRRSPIVVPKNFARGRFRPEQLAVWRPKFSYTEPGGDPLCRAEQTFVLALSFPNTSSAGGSG